MLVTTDFYFSAGFESNKDDQTTLNAIKRGELLVNTLTDGKCDEFSQSDETDINPVLLQLKQAICAQAEYYLKNGFCEDFAEVRLGDFTYTSGKFEEVCGLCRAILCMNNLTATACEAV